MNARNFRGTRDVFATEYLKREYVIKTVTEVYRSFGFELIETPVIETAETLSGKSGEGSGIFWLSGSSKGGLRFDHTVPLARFMAMRENLFVKPYKRAVIGPVFRNENTQAGRYRQFTQCDFDTVGSTSLIVDAEIPTVLYNVLSSLGFTDQYVIRINDRKLLNAITNAKGFMNQDQIKTVLRSWDNIDKKDKDEIDSDLISTGMTPKMVSTFNEVTAALSSLCGLEYESVITGVSSCFNQNPNVESALKEISNIFQYATSMGVPRERIKFWPLLARGLDYYTGPIFEVIVEESGIGSIAGGGRFDNLIENLGGPSIPASGASFGLERLIEVMDSLQLTPQNFSGTQIFVTVYDPENKKLCNKTFDVAKNLRLTGYSVELYTGKKISLGKQFGIAESKRIPTAIVLGPDEMNQKTIGIKNIVTREQITIQEEELLETLEKLMPQ